MMRLKFLISSSSHHPIREKMRQKMILFRITFCLVLPVAMLSGPGGILWADQGDAQEQASKRTGKGEGRTGERADSAGIAFFREKIQPVLEEKCYRCHEAGNKEKAGLAVDSLSALLIGGDTGPALIPGDSSASLLYTAIAYQDPEFGMPPKEQLLRTTVHDFKTWIEMGAPFPVESGVVGDAPGILTTITEVDGEWVTFETAESGESPSGRGKGKGRFRRRGNSGSVVTVRVDAAVLVTTATRARRSGDLKIGMELGSGLSNRIFEERVEARVVLEGEKIVEINVLDYHDRDEAPIAVLPKRPPLKTFRKK